MLVAVYKLPSRRPSLAWTRLSDARGGVLHLLHEEVYPRDSMPHVTLSLCTGPAQ